MFLRYLAKERHVRTMLDLLTEGRVGGFVEKTPFPSLPQEKGETTHQGTQP
jgi:hypothetical protein